MGQGSERGGGIEQGGQGGPLKKLPSDQLLEGVTMRLFTGRGSLAELQRP